MNEQATMNQQAIFEVMAPVSVEKIYGDEGTGAQQDVNVWRARMDSIPQGVYMIGDVAFGAHTSSFPPYAVVLVKPLFKYDHLGEIIKPPCSYEEIWTDKGSGGRQDGSFWRVHAPPGFAALGDVACNNYSQPTSEFTAKYACIRKDLLSAHAELSSPALWTDEGSGAQRIFPNLEVFTLPVAKIYRNECSNNPNYF